MGVCWIWGLRAGLEGPKGVSRALDLLVALLDGGRRHLLLVLLLRDHAHGDAHDQAAGQIDGVHREAEELKHPCPTEEEDGQQDEHVDRAFPRLLIGPLRVGAVGQRQEDRHHAERIGDDEHRDQHSKEELHFIHEEYSSRRSG